MRKAGNVCDDISSTLHPLAKGGVAELMNSSLHQLSQFTLCGRFYASFFSTRHHVWQNLVFKVSQAGGMSSVFRSVASQVLAPCHSLTHSPIG